MICLPPPRLTALTRSWSSEDLCLLCMWDPLGRLGRAYSLKHLSCRPCCCLFGRVFQVVEIILPNCSHGSRSSARMSKLFRNVPLLNSLEMSPLVGCSHPALWERRESRCSSAFPELLQRAARCRPGGLRLQPARSPLLPGVIPRRRLRAFADFYRLHVHGRVGRRSRRWPSDFLPLHRPTPILDSEPAVAPFRDRHLPARRRIAALPLNLQPAAPGTAPPSPG